MKPKNIVKMLRANKIKVRVTHYRNVIREVGDKPQLVRVTKENKKDFYELLSKGGETFLCASFPEGDYETSAICSKKEGYDRKVGIELCFSRILEQRRLKGQSNVFNNVELV